jgi:uncharacterized membrane protein
MTSRQQRSWQSKLFGDTRTNFYGWIVSGIITVTASLWFVILAFRAGASRSPTCLVLLGIYFLILGHFCIALQNYHSRLARKLDENKIEEDDANV